MADIFDSKTVQQLNGTFNDLIKNLNSINKQLDGTKSNFNSFNNSVKKNNEAIKKNNEQNKKSVKITKELSKSVRSLTGLFTAMKGAIVGGVIAAGAQYNKSLFQSSKLMRTYGQDISKATEQLEAMGRATGVNSKTAAEFYSTYLKTTTGVIASTEKMTKVFDIFGNVFGDTKEDIVAAQKAFGELESLQIGIDADFVIKLNKGLIESNELLDRLEEARIMGASKESIQSMLLIADGTTKAENKMKGMSDLVAKIGQRMDEFIAKNADKIEPLIEKIAVAFEKILDILLKIPAPVLQFTLALSLFGPPLLSALSSLKSIYSVSKNILGTFTSMTGLGGKLKNVASNMAGVIGIGGKGPKLSGIRNKTTGALKSLGKMGAMEGVKKAFTTLKTTLVKFVPKLMMFAKGFAASITKLLSGPLLPIIIATAVGGAIKANIDKTSAMFEQAQKMSAESDAKIASMIQKFRGHERSLDRKLGLNKDVVDNKTGNVNVGRFRDMSEEDKTSTLQKILLKEKRQLLQRGNAKNNLSDMRDNQAYGKDLDDAFVKFSSASSKGDDGAIESAEKLVAKWGIIIQKTQNAKKQIMREMGLTEKELPAIIGKATKKQEELKDRVQLTLRKNEELTKQYERQLTALKIIENTFREIADVASRGMNSEMVVSSFEKIEKRAKTAADAAYKRLQNYRDLTKLQGGDNIKTVGVETLQNAINKAKEQQKNSTIDEKLELEKYIKVLEKRKQLEQAMAGPQNNKRTQRKIKRLREEIVDERGGATRGRQLAEAQYMGDFQKSLEKQYSVIFDKVDKTRAGKLAQAESQAGLAMARVAMAKAQMGGLGLTVDTIQEAAGALEKQQKILFDQRADRIKEINKLRQELEAESAKPNANQQRIVSLNAQIADQTIKVRSETQKIVDLDTKRLNLTREIRDGYLSAIQSQAMAAGKFSKILFTRDQRLSDMTSLDGTTFIPTLGGKLNKDATKASKDMVNKGGLTQYSSTLGVFNNKKAVQDMMDVVGKKQGLPIVGAEFMTGEETQRKNIGKDVQDIIGSSKRLSTGNAAALTSPIVSALNQERIESNRIGTNTNVLLQQLVNQGSNKKDGIQVNVTVQGNADNATVNKVVEEVKKAVNNKNKNRNAGGG